VSTEQDRPLGEARSPDPDRESGGPEGRARTSAEDDEDDLARGAGVNYLGYVARIAPRVAFLVLAGRLYGDSGFGTYTFGITVAETLAAVALFGMKRSLFKFMSEAKVEGGSVHRAIANGVALSLTIGTLFAVATGAGAGVLGRVFGLAEAIAPLRVLSLAIPMIVLSDILLIAIRFTRQMRFEVYARSLAEPITLTLALVVFHWAGVGEVGLALAYVVSLVVAAAFTVYYFVGVFDLRAVLRAPLRRDDLRRLTTFSGPTAGYELFLMLADKVDIFLVSYFLPASSVGVYGMARQFATVTKKIRAGFDRILPPVLSESIETGEMGRAEDQLATVARWILTVVLLITVFFGFYAEPILGLVEEEFAVGALVLVLLMAGDAANGSLGVSELPFVYLRPVANVWFGIALLGTAVGLNFWLVPDLGVEGAALAMLLTFTVVNLARVWASGRWLGVTVVRPSILKPVVAALPATAAMVLAEWLLPETALLRFALQLPLLFLAYGATLFLLGLEPADRAQIRRVATKLGRGGGEGGGGEEDDGA